MNGKVILVTGGAGYIGSHVVRQLGEAGERVVVLDDLSTGFRQAVLHGELIVGNTGDRQCLEQVFTRFDIDTVMHFAAHTVVPESVADPLKYYRNNTCASRTLLEHSLRAGVRHVVFSSTAAVYGIPADGEASEDTPTAPINAYGTSKLMTEWMLRDVAAVNPLSYVALRYFNVAGSDPLGRIGQSTPKATLLTMGGGGASSEITRMRARLGRAASAPGASAPAVSASASRWARTASSASALAASARASAAERRSLSQRPHL
jgi:UDP-glucose 4-epimerase